MKEFVTCEECIEHREKMNLRISKLTVAHAVTIGLEIMIILLLTG